MTPITIYRQGDQHPQAQVCAQCEVRRTALFGALDLATLDRIHVQIDGLELDADQRVYGPRQDPQAVFTLRKGIVRFERMTEGGHRRIVRLAGPGDLIGQQALLGQPFVDEAVACTPAALCRIPTALVRDLGQHEPALMTELLLRLQRALDDAETWVAELATGPARRRVLHLLDKLQSLTDDDGTVWLPRRDEMGAMLDMTVETASRLVSQFRREGLLEPMGPRSARLDASRLQAAIRQQDAD